MDQATAKEIIKDTEYLDGRILVMEDTKKIKFCKIIWKGFSATQKDEDNNEGAARVRVKDLQKDEDNNEGAARVRVKDLMTGKEFTDNLTKIARVFPPELITDKEIAKANILSLLQENVTVESKTLEWIKKAVSSDRDDISFERLLTELWLESKITKARFKSDDMVVYNSRK